MSKKSNKSKTTGAAAMKTPKTFKVDGRTQLVPTWLVVPLWCIALALPNLIYSGVKFADTLHILKWTVAGVPVAIAALVAGWRLIRGRCELKLDLFAVLWALLVVLCLVETFWVKPSSQMGYIHEMSCFVAVWAFYILTIQSFPNGGLRVILWLANINAAINVLFAELQIRGLNDLAFLKDTWLEPLMQFRSIILPTPGNYIGNTAQQNMFGLWMAINVLGAIYLFVTRQSREIQNKRPESKSALSFSGIANLILLAINSWGLWNSTSRSGILSLLTGLTVMIALFVINSYRRATAKGQKPTGSDADSTGTGKRKLALALLIFAAIIGVTMTMDNSRTSGLIAKTGDMIVNAWSVGGRIGIWTTSKNIFLEHPMGVGVGQFKWHYLEGQRAGFARFVQAGQQIPDWYTWQYTHWAHNEFLQWFCEAGVIGGVLLLLMYGLWTGALVSKILSSKATGVIMTALALATALFLDLTLFDGLSTSVRALCDTCVAAAFALMLVLARSRNANPESTQKYLMPDTCIWGVALVVLISFNAFWTRPFHRIENTLWLTLAFALTNREFLSGHDTGVKSFLSSHFTFTRGLNFLLGIVFMLCAAAGVLYLGNGIEGNYLLRKALSTQEAGPQLNYLEQAVKHPITYEDATRNLGYHYLQRGEQSKNIEMINKGFNLIWQHFRREPHSEDYGPLMTYSQKFQIEPVIRELASYMRPGSYKLTKQKAMDSEGREIEALVIRTIQ